MSSITTSSGVIRVHMLSCLPLLHVCACRFSAVKFERQSCEKPASKRKNRLGLHVYIFPYKKGRWPLNVSMYACIRSGASVKLILLGDLFAMIMCRNMTDHCFNGQSRFILASYEGCDCQHNTTGLPLDCPRLQWQKLY